MCTYFNGTGKEFTKETAKLAVAKARDYENKIRLDFPVAIDKSLT